MKRPVVVALNPSIDAEWRVDGLRPEEKNNVLSERRWAGGKGVNVARWLKHHGAQPMLVLPLGGASGKEVATDLRRWRLASRVIRIREATRVNVIVTSPLQGQMRFNPLGPKISTRERSQIHSAVEGALQTASCLILSGSLPRGMSSGAYARFIRLAHKYKVVVLLDCDGAALAAAVRAKPFLVKPNEHELLNWFANAGGKRNPVKASIRLPRIPIRIQIAAEQLSRRTGGWILVSRGAQEALLVNAVERTAIAANPLHIKPRNTVGAGDAMLAAVALSIGRGERPAQWLRAGLQAGAIAVRSNAGQWQR